MSRYLFSALLAATCFVTFGAAVDTATADPQGVTDAPATATAPIENSPSINNSAGCLNHDLEQCVKNIESVLEGTDAGQVIRDIDQNNAVDVNGKRIAKV